MLLSEIASLVNISTSNQIAPGQMLLALDGVQKAAFQKNLKAFLVYDKRLKVRATLTFIASGYVSAISTDIGKSVVDFTTTTVIGTLVSYDNTSRTWTIEAANVPTASESLIVASGTGAGTLAASDFYEVFKGPYTAPNKNVAPNEPCRKVWGVTTRKPGRFDLPQVPCVPSDYNYRQEFPSNSRPFETGQVNDYKRTFEFAFEPSIVAEYYWVYWRNAPDITGLDDDENLVIPEEFHLHYQQAVAAYAAAIVAKEPFNQAVIAAYLGPWWETLMAPYRNQKGFQNMTQNPHQSSGSLL